MSYHVGIDLGTTYTAAAVHRDGIATIFTLGSRSATIPSVVLLRSDGTFLTGDAADRRAMSEPERVVREFKRRLGDSVPIIVAGSPYSAEQLMARMLESVMAEIQQREGGPPSRTVVCHPANWGNFKRDLLQQAIRMAGLDLDRVELLTEPEAAALSYAAQERVEPGQVVAVYDLGGGTFDAAVLRRSVSGFTILGKPEGIERLGGIDFDAAVFAHVTGGFADALQELDDDNPTTLAAIARLRQDCVEAKEALSSDTDTSVPVMLPNVQTEVRITRQELEGLIRPSLLDSLEAMRRAVRSANIAIEDVSRVLLVGGSSRIPLISQLVSSQLGRPVGVDAHPKHAVAIGASLAASGLLQKAAAAAGAEKTGGVPLDPLVTVVASPDFLENVRPPARAQRVAQGTPAHGQPVTPAVAKAQPVPPAGMSRRPQPAPPAGLGRAQPSSPGKSQQAPPGRPQPMPPGKAQRVPNPGPPPPSTGSSSTVGSTPPAGEARSSVPSTPRPAPPPASFSNPPPSGGGGGWPSSGTAAPGSARSSRSAPPDQRLGRPSSDNEQTTLYRPEADAGRTSVMPGSGGGATTPYPGGRNVIQPASFAAPPRQARKSRAGLWFVVILVLTAIAVAGAIIARQAGAI